ncbi:hypothetical protein [Curtobacterium sp. MCBD17_008]|uniref:hypothetical protein n=1 Tax=Curtobacterium sp. MCBD17_008 TaxID=2175656 RepID=UPI001C64AF47|nr:hypothetical protein [Curtobacterium sp. MCBD17_008]
MATTETFPTFPTATFGVAFPARYPPALKGRAATVVDVGVGEVVEDSPTVPAATLEVEDVLQPARSSTAAPPTAADASVCFEIMVRGGSFLSVCRNCGSAQRSG